MRSIAPLCLILSLSLAAACSDPDDSGKPDLSRPGGDGGVLSMSECPEPTGPGTMHAGFIQADETWTAAGSPHHVTSNLDIHGATVTVEQCALVRVATGASINVGESTGPAAKLVAVGAVTLDPQTQDVTSIFPVVFTADDPSDYWGSLQVNPTGFLDAQVTVLDRAGNATNNKAALVSRGDDNRLEPLRNVRALVLFVQSSATFGFSLSASGAFTEDSAALFVQGSGTQGVVSGGVDSSYAGYAEAPSIGTIPEGGTFTGNQRDEILVNTPFIFAGSERLKNLGVPYQVVSTWNQTPGAGKSSKLTIDAGTTIKVGGPLYTTPGFRLGSGPPGADLAAVQLVAAGTAAQPIVFTSGSATPKAGDWIGIDWKGGPATGNVLTNTTVEYAGAPSGINGFGCGPGATDGLLLLSNWRPAGAFVQGCTFRHSAGGGITSGWNSDEQSPDLKTGNTFSDLANQCDVSINKSAAGTCPGNDFVADCY